jgi:predicted RNase H-like HicB family nuclease
MIDHCAYVNELSEYCKDALKLAVVKNLGSGEGYSAKIPGFAGLVVFAPTRAEVVRELKSALEGWIELSLADNGQCRPRDLILKNANHHIPLVISDFFSHSKQRRLLQTQ